jgi:hypothetical protein
MVARVKPTGAAERQRPARGRGWRTASSPRLVRPHLAIRLHRTFATCGEPVPLRGFSPGTRLREQRFAPGRLPRGGVRLAGHPVAGRAEAGCRGLVERFPPRRARPRVPGTVRPPRKDDEDACAPRRAGGPVRPGAGEERRVPAPRGHGPARAARDVRSGRSRSVSSTGHASFRAASLPGRTRRGTVPGHLYGYQLAHGVIPRLGWGDDHPTICHTCDNHSCRQPRHLRLGTPAENRAEWLARRRDPTGPLADVRGPAGRSRAIAAAIRAGRTLGEPEEQIARRIETAVSAGRPLSLW